MLMLVGYEITAMYATNDNWNINENKTRINETSRAIKS